MTTINGGTSQAGIIHLNGYGSGDVNPFSPNGEFTSPSGSPSTVTTAGGLSNQTAGPVPTPIINPQSTDTNK